MFTVDSVESGVQAFQQHAVLNLVFCACSVSVLFVVQFQLHGELSHVLFYVLVSPPLFVELFKKYFLLTTLLFVGSSLRTRVLHVHCTKHCDSRDACNLLRIWDRLFAEVCIYGTTYA